MVRSRGVKGAGSAPTEGARRATGVGADAAAMGSGALVPGQRWSASRKRDVVLRAGAAHDAERHHVGIVHACSGGPVVVDLLELPASLNGRRRGRLMQRGKLAAALSEILLDGLVTIRRRHGLSLLGGTDLLEQPTSVAGDPQ